MVEIIHPEELKRQSPEIIKSDIISDKSPEQILEMLKRLRDKVECPEKHIPEKDQGQGGFDNTLSTIKIYIDTLIPINIQVCLYRYRCFKIRYSMNT